MPGIFDNDSFWIDEDELNKDDFDNLFVEEEEPEMQNNLESLDVSEDDFDEIKVPVELNTECKILKDTIPGSDLIVEEELEADDKEVKETNWADDGDHSKFVSYVKDKLTKIPRHSGETIPGNERAKAYLRSVDYEISKAMCSDLDGKIDEQEIDSLRKQIEGMIERLDSQINKLKGKTKKSANLETKIVVDGHCKKCGFVAPMWQDVENSKEVCLRCESSSFNSETIEKTAATPYINVYITPFERAIVGTIINSGISAGKNIEETYTKLKNKYNFTPREELAIQQLVADYGYPVFKDRGLLNEPSDPASGDGVEWQTNYPA